MKGGPTASGVLPSLPLLPSVRSSSSSLLMLSELKEHNLSEKSCPWERKPLQGKHSGSPQQL